MPTLLEFQRKRGATNLTLALPKWQSLLASRVRVLVDPKQAVFRGVGIDLGRGERNVPEQLFYREQIGSCFQQMRREGVSQRMSGESPRTGGDIEAGAYRGLDGAPREASTACIHEQRVIRSVRDLRAPRLVVSDRPETCFGNGNDAFFPALAHHANQLRAPVDRSEVYAVQLGEPQTAAVEKLENDEVAGSSKGILFGSLLRFSEDV